MICVKCKVREVEEWRDSDQCQECQPAKLIGPIDMDFSLDEDGKPTKGDS